VGTGKESAIVKKLLGCAMALALALMALLPGISAARLASNHNRTRLRD
jgi:hypothetical protein